MSTVSSKLPSICFELKVLGDERPIEGGLPVGDVKVFVDLDGWISGWWSSR